MRCVFPFLFPSAFVSLSCLLLLSPSHLVSLPSLPLSAVLSHGVLHGARSLSVPLLLSVCQGPHSNNSRGSQMDRVYSWVDCPRSSCAWCLFAVRTQRFQYLLV